MGKRLILILTFAFVIGMVAGAYAEVQNVKVSGDILMEGIGRYDLTLRKTDAVPPGGTVGAQYGQNIGTFLSHVRVRVDADLTDNVSATVRLLNERTWDTETSTSTDIDLDLAYATMKEFLYSPLTLTVGRQELHFGNDFIMGDVDTSSLMAGHNAGGVTAANGSILPNSIDDLSLRKSFDAIRATLNYDPLVVDAVFARISKTINSDNGVNLWGVNANYALRKDTTVEAYYWLKKRDKVSTGTAIVGPVEDYNGSHNDTVNTIGGRVQNTTIKNLTVGLEAAYQFGNKMNSTVLYPDDLSNDGGYRHRKAWAMQFTSKYSLADLVKKYDPMIAFNYTLLSGDSWKRNAKNYGGWDPMYHNQAVGTLFNKILGYTNAQFFNVSSSAKPMSDLTLSLDYYYIRLMRAFRATNGGITSTVAVNLSGVGGDPTYNMKANENSLGNEIDAKLIYDYTEDVQLGLNLGWFITGDAFAKNDGGTTGGNKETASQIIGSMKVTF